jgi:hypothetical protein
MQFPDPGYAGTNFEIYQDHEELDWISYWDECEYVDDEYWDNAPLGALASKPTTKRKREENITASPGVKRRRLLMAGIENVKFVSLAKRLERYEQLPPLLGNVKPVALLPDWRERFANSSGEIVEKPMPEAMKKAAEAQDEDTPLKERRFDALVEEGDDEEWMDEGEVEGEDEAGGDMAALLASLDPEMLQTVLDQKLGGLGEAERSAFMSAFAKMRSGDGGADDALGELANVLLGQATKENDSAISGWLSRQGVSLEEAEDDDVSSNELPDSLEKASGSNVEVSPPDSAIEMLKQKAETRQMAIHGSSPSASGKKRAAPTDPEEEGTTKRKKVAFDVPASSQPTETAILENGDAETHDADVAHEIEKDAEPTTSDDPLMSEPTVHSTTMKTKSKAEGATSTNDKAVKTNGSISARSTGARNYAKPTAAASAKQTRKRKAEADEDDVEAGRPEQKRPARKAAKSEPEVPAVEPAGRRTRSARAKAGK